MFIKIWNDLKINYLKVRRIYFFNPIKSVNFKKKLNDGILIHRSSLFQIKYLGLKIDEKGSFKKRSKFTYYGKRQFERKLNLDLEVLICFRKKNSQIIEHVILRKRPKFEYNEKRQFVRKLNWDLEILIFYRKKDSQITEQVIPRKGPQFKYNEKREFVRICAKSYKFSQTTTHNKVGMFFCTYISENKNPNLFQD